LGGRKGGRGGEREEGSSSSSSVEGWSESKMTEEEEDEEGREEGVKSCWRKRRSACLRPWRASTRRRSLLRGEPRCRR